MLYCCDICFYWIVFHLRDLLAWGVSLKLNRVVPNYKVQIVYKICAQYDTLMNIHSLEFKHEHNPSAALLHYNINLNQNSV